MKFKKRMKKAMNDGLVKFVEDLCALPTFLLDLLFFSACLFFLWNPTIADLFELQKISFGDSIHIVLLIMIVSLIFKYIQKRD